MNIHRTPEGRVCHLEFMAPDHRTEQLRFSRQVVRAVLVVMLGVGAYLAAAWLVR